MELQSTGWFPLSRYAPVRDGWYEVRLANDETAFAKYSSREWSEKPPIVFTHWRGLTADPGPAADSETFDAAATAAVGVRAAWNAFFPGLGDKQHKPHDISRAQHKGK